MKFLHILLFSFFLIFTACKKNSYDSLNPEISNNSTMKKIKLFVELPDGCNTPDGMTLDKEDNIIVSMPNFSNDELLKNNVIKSFEPEKMIIIDKNNKVSDFYIFTKQDKHIKTGKIGPMECCFGPDGNLYIADNQNIWNQNHSSRVVRINMEDGKATNMDVVVEGFNFCNGLIWRDNKMYVTESILVQNKKDELKKTKLKSGVYSFTMEELKSKKIFLEPYTPNKKDLHLLVEFESSNKKGFGADGITFDSNNNLFTSIVEDGIIYKTEFDNLGKVTKTSLFASGMTSSDGMVYDKSNNLIYVADFFDNAVYSVNVNGEVKIIHKNQDTDGKNGLLDQPAALVLRKNELIISNMDVSWMAKAKNKKTDKPFTLSVINLE